MATTTSAPSDADIEEKLSAMQKALNQFIEASDSGELPEDDSNRVDAEAYVSALKKASHLIEEESNPLLFLRRDKGDAVAAARRLLAYWGKRVTFFGPEKAFLPMREALNQEEAGLVGTGIFVQLPPNQAGQDVFCMDVSRRSRGFGGEATKANRARGMFWITSLAFSNPKSQTDGIVMLIPLVENSTMNIPGGAAFRDLFETVLPIKIDAVHITCCPSPGTKRIFKNCLIPAYKQAVIGWSDSKALKTHIGKSREDLIRKLGTVGLTEQSIPETIGGSWKYSFWSSFITQELACCGQDCLKRPAKPKKIAKSVPLKKRICMAAKIEASKKNLKDPPGVASLPAKIEASKNTPSVASLDYTRTEKGQSDSTTGNQKDRKNEANNTSLSALGIRLDQEYEGLYTEETMQNLAAAMLTNLGRCSDHTFATQEEKDAFLKKRDTVYSKRKYYKKKLKIESLKRRKDYLVAEGEMLKRETRRLESLVADAKRIEETVCCKAPSGSLLKLPPASARKKVQVPQSKGTPVLQLHQTSPLVKPAAPTATSTVVEFLRQRESATPRQPEILSQIKPPAAARKSSGVADFLRQHEFTPSLDTGGTDLEKGQAIDLGQHRRNPCSQPSQMPHPTARSLQDQPNRFLTSSSTQGNSSSAVVRNYDGGISNTAQSLSDLEALLRRNSGIAQASVSSARPDQDMLASLVVGTTNRALLSQRAAETGRHLLDLPGFATLPSNELLMLQGLARLGGGFSPNSEAGVLDSLLAGPSPSEKEVLLLSLLQSQQGVVDSTSPAFLTNPHSVAHSQLSATASISLLEEQQRHQMLLSLLQTGGLVPVNNPRATNIPRAVAGSHPVEEELRRQIINSRRDNLPF